MPTVVLVEGTSDALALRATAARLGTDLRHVDVVATGGITNLRAHLQQVPSGTRVAGLYDAQEHRHVERALAAAGRERDAPAFHACHRDLEDELVRALGVPGVEQVIARQGELPRLRRLQEQPAHRSRPVEQQLRRFFGGHSGSKARYAPLLVDALEPDDLPAPLRELVLQVS